MLYVFFHLLLNIFYFRKSIRNKFSLQAISVFVRVNFKFVDSIHNYNRITCTIREDGGVLSGAFPFTTLRCSFEKLTKHRQVKLHQTLFSPGKYNTTQYNSGIHDNTVITTYSCFLLRKLNRQVMVNSWSKIVCYYQISATEIYKFTCVRKSDDKTYPLTLSPSKPPFNNMNVWGGGGLK